MEKRRYFNNIVNLLYLFYETFFNLYLLFIHTCICFMKHFLLVSVSFMCRLLLPSKSTSICFSIRSVISSLNASLYHLQYILSHEHCKCIIGTFLSDLIPSTVFLDLVLTIPISTKWSLDDFFVVQGITEMAPLMRDAQVIVQVSQGSITQITKHEGINTAESSVLVEGHFHLTSPNHQFTFPKTLV